eukprot:TRINITY_DN28259_c0_g1_i1.p1 TRINITY_DN28259_c0_g1~~TRINITY_DN28259_c0_g1_i1.p1  ORF type:complete len:190 (+),score=71.89 TRINITY_DN28259_c0_g1_i1:39-608(+)
MGDVWQTVLATLRSKNLEFADVQMAEDADRENILREVFPTQPLCRAYANTVWVRLAWIYQTQDVSPQREQLSELDIWAAFLTSLAQQSLLFEDVQFATLADRQEMLGQVFPSEPMWRAKALAFWAQLTPLAADAPAPASPMAVAKHTRVQQHVLNKFPRPNPPAEVPLALKAPHSPPQFHAASDAFQQL